MVKNSLRAAIYARVSSEAQAKENTIASQIEALERRIRDDGLRCDPELVFVDDGISGSSLIRPSLERLRDQAAAGVIDRLYVHSPDRLARRYAYQVLLVEELTRSNVEVVFLNNPMGSDPEQNLLLQVQGMIAEYERAKIMERSRRGKQHAARRGSVNVLTGAPYGYRYIGKHEGDGQARYQVLAHEARVVRQVFEWIGQEHCSIEEVCRRLRRNEVPTRKGKAVWGRNVVWLMLKNPAYKGTAVFGKTRAVSNQPKRPRRYRGHDSSSRRSSARIKTSPDAQISINVPPLVSEELFNAVQAQLEENRRRRRIREHGPRYLLQGLVVCQKCHYAWYGRKASPKPGSREPFYAYYRCTGSDSYRFGGQRICWNKQIRVDRLDAAVWDDVRGLLSEPARIQAEYQRRLERTKPGDDCRGKELDKLVKQAKKTIARLIDAYEEGLIEKLEFEPRILAARQRLFNLEQQSSEREEEEDSAEQLRVVIGQLEAFAEQVFDGLEEPEWATKRQIIQALVKRVEIHEDDVRIVYRVAKPSLDRGPEGCSLQHRSGGDLR
jgi:site-specific DNA recombinase